MCWGLGTVRTEIPGVEVRTFSQRPRADLYNRPEMCPGQSSPFDFSSEEPATDNTGRDSHRAQVTGWSPEDKMSLSLLEI